MSSEHKVLRLFLASPGDLAPERRMVSSLIDEVNGVYEEQGWRIQLQKWENVLPAANRPQDIINEQYVDTCDLFLGLVWKHWGSPPGGNEYTSGFEEEFHRAYKRFANNGEPAIWIAFKHLPKPVRTRRKHLTHIQKFRDFLTARKIVTYKEFKTSTQLKNDLRNWILRYLNCHIQQIQRKQSVQKNIAEFRKQEGKSQHATSLANSTATNDIVEILTKATTSINQSHREPLTDIQLAHLHVLSCTLIGPRVGALSLGVHEANMVYRNRLKLNCNAEQGEELVFHTLILGNVPGWYFYNTITKPPGAFLEEVALGGRTDELRLSALKLILNAGLGTSELDYNNFFDTLFSDQNKQIVDTAVEIFERTATASQLPLLDIANTRGVNTKLVRLRILSRLDRNAFFDELFDSQLHYDDRLHFPDLNVDDIPKIKKLISMNNQSARLCAISNLVKLESVEKDLLLPMLEDPTNLVRSAALRALIGIGAVSDPEIIAKSQKVISSAFLSYADPYDKDALLFALFSKIKLEAVESHLEAFALGRAAYKALSIRKSISVSQIRTDLSNDFERLFNLTEKRYGLDAGTLLSDDPSTKHFLISEFRIVALQSLLELGDHESDLIVAKRFIDDREERVSGLAISMLAKWGDATDVPGLIVLAKKRSQVRSQALAAAKELLQNDTTLLYKILAEGDDDLIISALEILKIQPVTPFLAILEELLYRDNTLLRKAALRFIISGASDTELNALVERYPQAASYYYDVMWHLDAVLFAPHPLLEHFRKNMRLEETVNIDDLED